MLGLGDLTSFVWLVFAIGSVDGLPDGKRWI